MKSKTEIQELLEKKEMLLDRNKRINHFENIKTLECQIKLLNWILEGE